MKANAYKLIDPAALMRIRTLELRARVIVEGFLHGIHRSPYHGFSVEFSEYRDYVPGDEMRHIDWRVFARSDRFYIKRFEDETNLRAHFLVDQSRSMSFSSGTFTKAEYASTLCATLAQFLFMQGDAVGLVSFDEKAGAYLPARCRPGHLKHLMLELEKPSEGRGTDLCLPLKQVADWLRKRGLLVLISDLLAPPEELEEHLGYLRVRGHEVAVFHLLDPAELDFSFDLPALFHDLETDREILVDPLKAAPDYARRLKQHLETIERACRNLGVDYFRVPTDRPLELALLDFLSGRRRSHTSPRRRRA